MRKQLKNRLHEIGKAKKMKGCPRTAIITACAMTFIGGSAYNWATAGAAEPDLEAQIMDLKTKTAALVVSGRAHLEGGGPTRPTVPFKSWRGRRTNRPGGRAAAAPEHG